MRHVALLAAFTCLTLVPGALDAQVTPQEASAFLGSWAASIDGPQGSIDMNIDIADADGMVEAAVEGPDGSMTFVDDIALDGSTLTLSYEVDFGGQGIPITLMLEPADAGLDVTMSGAGGQFTADGSAALR